MTARRDIFGTLPDGRPVPAVTSTNASGVAATIIAWGASLQSLVLPGSRRRRGRRRPRPCDDRRYLDRRNISARPSAASPTGSRAGRFTLDGTTYQLPVNDGANSLHGGTAGSTSDFGQVGTCGRARPRRHPALVSPDGDQGYPGTLDGHRHLFARATTTALRRLSRDDRSRRRSSTSPTMSIGIWPAKARPAARWAIADHPRRHYQPTDAGAIPTGEFRPVAGTASTSARRPDRRARPRRADEQSSSAAATTTLGGRARGAADAALLARRRGPGLGAGDARFFRTSRACNSIRAISSTATTSGKAGVSIGWATRSCSSRNVSGHAEPAGIRTARLGRARPIAIS